MKRQAVVVSLFSVVLIALIPVAEAATTVIDAEVGGAIQGTIGEAGVDTVEAHFTATEGTELQILVRAVHGASLRPTVVLKNAAGMMIAGSTRTIGWVPGGTVIHYVTIPVTGAYYAEIGGSSGSGDFVAELRGTLAPGPLPANLAGTVTDGLTGDPVDGAGIFLDNVLFATTDATGAYSGEVDPGTYTVRCEAGGYESDSSMVTIAAGASVQHDFSMLPLVPVLLTASVSGSPDPGAGMTAEVDVTIPAGFNVNSITWTQTAGVPVDFGAPGPGGTPFTLGTTTDYKDELIHLLSEPPVGQEQLPPNVQIPEEFPGGLPSRFQVVGVNPFALEETALVVLEVEVDTDLGVFHAEVEIHTHLPWKVASGLENVPFGDAVLLHGEEQLSYDWALYPPPGSLATLTDDATRNPWFVPDVDGHYTLEVTSEEAGALVTLHVYAGAWVGVIEDQDLDGRPMVDNGCLACHNDLFAADKFDDWAQTGHAEILTDNIDTSGYYGTRCFGCHTVGFGAAEGAGGIEQAEDYQDFLAAGLLGNPGDNWTTMLEQYPETARLANIQCENCHGPQDSLGHGFGDPPGDSRIDLSSDVCATCHGEPLRHARFQQWQLSGHANYELAVDEGDRGSCSKCHTANGFLAWLPVLLDNDPNTSPEDDVEITWSLSEVHPQTCATCHDPHAEGTTSGANTNATVRISGDTPPLAAGFTATDVGRGAICMTCHNSRRGLRNDATWPNFVGTTEAARAPHGSAQTDVLFGQNAYMMTVPSAGAHAEIEDGCVTCHMESTPPPDVLAYNGGGTNHTFFAGKDICGDCHSDRLTAEDVQDSVGFLLHQVEELVEEQWYDVMAAQLAAGHEIDLNGEAMIVDINDVSEVVFGETRGRQALTVTVGGTAYGPHRLQDIDVIDPAGPTDLGALLFFGSDTLLQAGWNAGLIHNDGSLGVHNPFFASDALTAARDALLGGASPAVTPNAPTPRDLWRSAEERERFSKGGITRR